jgi:hypothetical protein
VFDIIPDVCARNNIDDQQSLVGKVTADSAGHGLGSLKTADSFSIHKWPLPVFFHSVARRPSKQKTKERAVQNTKSWYHSRFRNDNSVVL